MASPKAAGRPNADVFLPAQGQAGGMGPGAGGGQKILGVDRRTAIIIGAVVLAVAGYLVYRHYKNSSSASAGTAASASNIDPATGFPYGSPEDLAAQGQAGGGSGGASPSGATSDPTGLTSGGGDPLQSTVDALLAALTSPSTSGAPVPSPVPVTVTVQPAAAPAAGKQPGVGGGTSPPPAIHLPTTVSGSGPIASVLGGGAAALGGAAGADIGAGQDFTPGPVSAQVQFQAPPVAAYTPAPKTASAPYTTPVTANPTGGSATKKQGVISVH